MTRDRPSTNAISVEALPGVASTLPGPFEANYSPKLAGPRVVERIETAGGYGTDPNMVTPHSPWPKTLTLYERHVIGALADLILTAGNHEPAPTAVGITDFFDDWLSAPYPQQLLDRAQILSGLQRVDQNAQASFGYEFLQLTDAQKRAVLDRMIKSGGDNLKFFIRFRYLVVGGYYTSDVGMRLIGYRGNVPLHKPAEISKEVLVIVEAELRKLGL